MSTPDTRTSASGETKLDVLIRSMQPVLHDDTYVFATVAPTYNCNALSPVMTFREPEGVTLILAQAAANKAGIDHEFPCRMITLNIHSSLDAVGFLARITTHLAQLQMGVNPVSGFYHDHLFVPADRAQQTLQALVALSKTQ